MTKKKVFSTLAQGWQCWSHGLRGKQVSGLGQELCQWNWSRRRYDGNL